MEKSIVIKSLTLSGFILLMIGFIAFRTGAFDKYLKEEKPVSILLGKVKQSSFSKIYPESSTAVEPNFEFKFEEKVMGDKNYRYMWASSKSGPVYDPYLAMHAGLPPYIPTLHEAISKANEQKLEFMKKANLKVSPEPSKKSPHMLSTSKSITVVEQQMEFTPVTDNLPSLAGLESDTPAWQQEKVKESPYMFSGSKSRTVMDQKLKFKVRDTVKHSPSMMGSSKIMILTDQQLKFGTIPVDSFLKEELKLRQSDSLKSDSIKQTQSK